MADKNNNKAEKQLLLAMNIKAQRATSTFLGYETVTKFILFEETIVSDVLVHGYLLSTNLRWKKPRDPEDPIDELAYIINWQVVLP